jgi:hypothetical protein
MAERLRTEIARPLTLDGVELFVTGSIGIAVADRPDATASDLLRDADAAMYRAKARGRDCVEVFAQGVHDASVATLRTTNELRRGIERDEIVPYYQPIVDLDSGVSPASRCSPGGASRPWSAGLDQFSRWPKRPGSSTTSGRLSCVSSPSWGSGATDAELPTCRSP